METQTLQLNARTLHRLLVAVLALVVAAAAHEPEDPVPERALAELAWLETLDWAGYEGHLRANAGEGLLRRPEDEPSDDEHYVARVIAGALPGVTVKVFAPPVVRAFDEAALRRTLLRGTVGERYRFLLEYGAVRLDFAVADLAQEALLERLVRVRGTLPLEHVQVQYRMRAAGLEPTPGVPGGWRGAISANCKFVFADGASTQLENHLVLDLFETGAVEPGTRAAEWFAAHQPEVWARLSAQDGGRSTVVLPAIQETWSRVEHLVPPEARRALLREQAAGRKEVSLLGVPFEKSLLALVVPCACIGLLVYLRGNVHYVRRRRPQTIHWLPLDPEARAAVAFTRWGTLTFLPLAAFGLYWYRHFDTLPPGEPPWTPVAILGLLLSLGTCLLAMDLARRWDAGQAP